MRKLLILLIIIPLLNSCFKEDTPVIPSDSGIITLKESMYSNQVFFDLGTSGEASVNPVEAWDLGFESSHDGWHITVNSGRYLGLVSTGSTDFNNTTTVDPGAKWKYDKSDGNPDSTAVGKWISDDLLTPTNEVYMLGINNGIKYVPYKKVVFTAVGPKSYSFHYSDPDGSNPVSVTMLKDSTVNYTCFSLNTGTTVGIEPPKDSWELLFTQYSTTLYTSDSIPTPYFVRGVLSNPYGTASALDSLKTYDEISISDTAGYKFSTLSDAIGYDWKRVKINDVTATYTVRDNYTYIIRSRGKAYYKLRFRGFYNDTGAPGYPKFEYKKLQVL